MTAEELKRKVGQLFTHSVKAPIFAEIRDLAKQGIRDAGRLHFF